MIRSFVDITAVQLFPSRIRGAHAPRAGQGTAAGGRPRTMIPSFVTGFILLSFMLWPNFARAATPTNGDKIINSAIFSFDDGSSNTSQSEPAALQSRHASVTVNVVTRTRSTIDFLKYAPGVSGASSLSVSPTSYADSYSGPFATLPVPRTIGGNQTAIDLSSPLPLLTSSTFHAGEPLFIRVTDLDQNLDSTTAETIIVTVTDPQTGDSETLQLTESGVNSGVFIGYIQTNSTATASYNGILSVSESSTINARYTDRIDGTDSSVDAALVDPFGIVFDTRTGKPVDGATVELLNSDGTPATVLGDNGLPTNAFPNTVTSGGTASDAQGFVYSFIPGGYRFPFVFPGNYLLKVTPPAGYSFPSVVTTTAIQVLPGGPFTILEPGSRGEMFTVPIGPAIRLDLPIDPMNGTLWLRKSAGKSIVSAGEHLGYELTLENNDTAGTVFSPVITDKLPPGFRYVPGSVKINGLTATDPAISFDGSNMTFTLADIPPATAVSIRYVVAVGSGAVSGAATNSAFAASAAAGQSNSATATVQVQEPFMQSRSLIMGRVFVGACSENPEDSKKGLEGIGIYLEDGTFVITDKFGLFHFEGVRPGTHVVQLDLDSIPEGYEILPCEQNSRFAGRAYSQFVDMQGGTMWRADFYLGKKELVKPAAEKSVELPVDMGMAAELQDKPAPAAVMETKAPVTEPADRLVVTPFRGEVSLEMESSKNEEIIDYRLPLQAHTVPLKKLVMTVVLPEGAKYIAGSSSFNGAPLNDPEITAKGLAYTLEDATDKWRRELQFRAFVDKGRSAGELVTRASLRFDTDIASGIVTPEVTNILAITKDEKIIPLPLFVFRPHFPTFGDRLSDDDKLELDGLVAGLKDKIVKRIDVTGHTDNVRIAPRSRRIHADNRALSLARARSVGRYLAAALKLPPEALILNGSGEKEPIATNRTATGRALNRRVEVKITALQRVEITDLKIVKERSGLEKIETTGAPKIESVPEPPPPSPLPRLEETLFMQAASNASDGVLPENGSEAVAPRAVTITPETAPAQPGGSGNRKSAARPSEDVEHVELFSTLNDGIVHYRLRLVGIKEPLHSITATLITPGSFLYLAGTTQLSGKPAADPEIRETAITYKFNPLAGDKNLDLKFQALLDGDDRQEALGSSVTVVMATADGAPLKTLTATAELADNMEEINRPDDTVVEEAAPLQKKPEQAIADNSAEFIEKIAAKAVPAATPAARAPDDLAVKEQEGILSPSDGTSVATRINAVRIVLNAQLTPVLMLDGVEIPAERIGFSMKDHKTDKALYTFIGVDFGDAGEHTLQLKGQDTFGITRFQKTATITRTGEISAIKLVYAEGNIADGRSPVRVRVQLFDKDNKLIRANAELAIKGGDLRPVTANRIAAHNNGNAMVNVSPEGWLEFNPVTSSGLYRTQLAYNKATVEIETYVKPKMRDWILVGIAEGSAGYNTVSGHMENLKSSGVDDNFYDRERLALYAKGTIKGEWLLTMAYDSDKQRTGVSGNALFQTIDPNSYYTLYGDATAQGYEAASQKKLYLKIERDQFYALFGDFDTGLSVTELSRYSRRMNGIKSEYRSKDLEMTAFGSETGQAFVKDEIRGDGTSGLYRLSRSGIVINSERITIESRDRFHSEIITSSHQVNRFIDYTIDYDQGTIYFKSPVASRDEQLNPVYIVVDYEVADSGSDALTYGGRVGTTLLDGRLKAGVTYIREGQISGESNLYGIDATVNLSPETKARAEIATTTNDLGSTRNSGNAYLTEVVHTGKNLEARAYYREQEEGFGVGQQNGSETDTRKFGAEGLYRINQQVSLSGQAFRQYNLATGAVRDFIEGGGIYSDKQYSTRAGLRYANDSLADGSNAASVQGTFGGHWKTKDLRLTLRAEHEQSLFNNDDNADYPTRTILGADYQVSANTMVFAQQEMTYGDAAETFTTLAGIKSTPWSGGSLATTMGNDMKENSERTFAIVGLSQKWQISPLWTVDGGLDRNQTIRQKNNYQFNSNVPPASGGEDFTAVSLGANYTEKKILWSNRVEFRDSDTTDKWGILSGFVNEQGNNWGWTTRLQLLHTQSPGNNSRTDAELRLGLAYRPPLTRWIVLDRLDTIYSEDTTASATIKSRRLVNNLNVNYKPDRKTQLSLQYGAKYVLETIDDSDYSGYTDLIGIEGRYDITPRCDIGMRGSILHSWELNQFNYSLAPSIGFNVAENAWVNLGYNIAGFEDRDFSKGSFTAQGPFVQFRFKFDQNSLKDGLNALNN